MYIGQKARHKEVCNGKETLEIVGIRADTVELKGGFQVEHTTSIRLVGFLKRDLFSKIHGVLL
jgi:hypothetical protein